MTDKQPTALRMADWLEVIGSPVELCEQVATELRRLHALNVELLNALHSISLASKDSGSTREGMGLYARAAIAKAEGKQ